MKKSFEKSPLSSKVLLLCIDNKNNSIITQKLLYSLFTPFGTPKQILIFERGKVWKAFVEMETEAIARIAKNALHNQLIFSDGTKMLVHFSTLDKISFQDPDIAKGSGSFRSLVQSKPGVLNPKKQAFSSDNIEMDMNTHFDFADPQKIPFLSSPMSPAMTPLLYNPIMSPVMTPLLNNVSETTHSRHELSQKGHPHVSFGSFSSMQTSGIKSPGLTEKNEDIMKKTLKKFKSLHMHDTHEEKLENEEELGDIAEQKSMEDIFSPTKQNHGNAILNKEYKILFDIKEDYLPANKIEEYKEDSLNLREHEEDMRHFHSIFPTKKQVFVLPLSSPIAKNTLRIDPMKLQDLELDSIKTENSENWQGLLLKVGEIDENEVNTQMIFNLFSNFGNIFYIIFPRKKKQAIISFQTTKQAETACLNLNGMFFYGRKLAISFLPFQEIEFISYPTASDEIFIGNDRDFRFKSLIQKKLVINPPSTTLHVSNLKTEACNYEQIFEIFKNFGNVEAIKFKVLDHYKNMCLVKYSALEESLAAMANLHDFELMKRKIKVSFTKSKIEKE